MERIVQRGDRVEVVGGRFKGYSGTIRDPNINQLVRGGPVH
jgi:ribosomal protein L24